jgi:hypothetical protein
MIYSRKKKRTPTDYGMKDYYKFYKEKYDPEITRKKYHDIIAEFNTEVMDLIINEGLEYLIPYIYITLCVRKDKRAPKIVNGRLYNNTPVDWVKTNKLWVEDEDAKERKILVRFNNSHTSGYVFRIYAKKFSRTYRNKRYYKFKTARDFNRALAKRINDESKDKFDSFKLY